MTESPINKNSTVNLNRLEECRRRTRSTTCFPNCALACIMIFGLIRAEESGWRFSANAFGRDDEGRDLVCTVICHYRILILQSVLYDSFYCIFQLFVVKATCVIADRDNPGQNIIDFEHGLGKLLVFGDAIVNRLQLSFGAHKG